MVREISVGRVQEGPRLEDQARYVYAIVKGLPRRWRPPASGVGASPVVAHAVRDLVLISSVVDAVPSPTPRSVALHEAVLLSTLEADAVLPLAFGTVLPVPHVETWLAVHRMLIRTHLARLRRHVEMTVRLVSLGTDGPVGSALRATAERVVERAGLPEWRYRDDGGAGFSSSLSFLVPREGVADFLTRIGPIAARAGRVAVVPTGPWAPCSFTPRLAPVPGAARPMPEPLARAG